MATITIPKQLAKGGDLVVIPRKEYEAMRARMVPEFTPTKANLRALDRMRKNRAAGKLITLDELKRKLARTR